MISRQFRSAEQWRRIFTEQQRSGLTVAAFCQERGISQGSFYAWKKRLRPVAAARPAVPPRFVELQVAGTPPPAEIEIELASQRRVLVRPGFDPDLLLAVLRTLEGLT